MNAVSQRSPTAQLASGPFRREVRQWGTVRFQGFVEESVTAVRKLFQTRHKLAEMHRLLRLSGETFFFLEHFSKMYPKIV